MCITNDETHTYDIQTSSTINMDISLNSNTKPTITGCNFYNPLHE